MILFLLHFLIFPSILLFFLLLLNPPLLSTPGFPRGGQLLRHVGDGGKERQQEGQVLHEARLQPRHQRLEHHRRLRRSVLNRLQIRTAQEQRDSVGAAPQGIGVGLVVVKKLLLLEHALHDLEVEAIFLAQHAGVRRAGREGAGVRGGEQRGCEEGGVADQSAEQEDDRVEARGVAEGQVVLEERGEEAAGEEALELGERLARPGARHAREESDDGVLYGRRGQQQELREHLHLDDQHALRLQPRGLGGLYASRASSARTAARRRVVVQHLRQQQQPARHAVQRGRPRVRSLGGVVQQGGEALHAAEQKHVVRGGEQRGVKEGVVAEGIETGKSVAEDLRIEEGDGRGANEDEERVDERSDNVIGVVSEGSNSVESVIQEEETGADGGLGIALEDRKRLFEHHAHFGLGRERDVLLQNGYHDSLALCHLVEIEQRKDSAKVLKESPQIGVEGKGDAELFQELASHL